MTETPLDPDVATEAQESEAADESQVEATAEETAEEAETETEARPSLDDYRRIARQEAQQERANLSREFKSMLEDALKAKTPERRESRLDKIQERLKGVDGQTLAAQSPELKALLDDLAEELADARKGINEVSSVKSRQEAIEAFDAYMEDKPSGFREAFTKHQRTLVQKYRDRGVEVTPERLQFAMTEWADSWLEGKKTAQPATPKAPGVNRIVPAQGGARKKIDSSSVNAFPFGR